MAHGYYLMTGKPQCAMVHVNVGTANALMGLSMRREPTFLYCSLRVEHRSLRMADLGVNAPIHWDKRCLTRVVWFESSSSGTTNFVPADSCRYGRPSARD